VGGACALRVLHVTPPNSQKYPSVMSLEASLRPLLDSATCVDSDEVACHRWALLFFLLSPPWKLQLDHLCYWYFNLVLIFLKKNFCSWPFYRIVICFQFYPSILICHLLFFFNLVLILLIFLSLLLDLIFFSISPLNENFVCISYFNFDPPFFIFVKMIFRFNFTFQLNINFIWYFSFDHHSFNCYFF